MKYSIMSNRISLNKRKKKSFFVNRERIFDSNKYSVPVLDVGDNRSFSRLLWFVIHDVNIAEMK
jgi:hypothetical protein